MKILHTSDWHLDHRLYDRRRTDEHRAFLDWLCQTIIDREVDILIVSGDIFDNRTPTLDSKQLYFRFLTQLYESRLSGLSKCRAVIITAGNHDSASFLETDKPILRYLNISVVAQRPEIIVIPSSETSSPSDFPAIIVAMPFLSDVELRKSSPEESAEDKAVNLMLGLRSVYRSMATEAQTRQSELLQTYPYAPIIATGHLFAQGSKSLGSDAGERDIYVGSLGQFPAGDFPQQFDYIALGHLHVPQTVGGEERIQYSGSPIPIGFGESGQTKRVIEVNWGADGIPVFTSLPVPQFQKLVQISESDKSAIEQRVKTLVEESKQSDQCVWLEIVYRGVEAPGELPQTIDEILSDSNITLLAFKWIGIREVGISPLFKGETLQSLDPIEVFKRTLTSMYVKEEERDDLIKMYEEILYDSQSAASD